MEVRLGVAGRIDVHDLVMETPAERSNSAFALARRTTPYPAPKGEGPGSLCAASSALIGTNGRASLPLPRLLSLVRLCA